MTLEEENAALRAEVARLTKLSELLRAECSVGFAYGMVRRSPTQSATAAEPRRSLLDL